MTPLAEGLARPVQMSLLERHGQTGALLILLVGFGVRVGGLSEYWLNPDEGIYYSALTRGPFGDFWTDVMANAHPPAFYLLLRGVGFLTWDFVWLRGTSLLFGTAAIWIFWLVGRELGGTGRSGVAAGLVTAGVLAASGDAIAFSQVLRPYMLLLLLLGGALLHLLRYRSHPSDRTLVAYVAFLCLAILTHYSAALAFAVFCAVVGYYRLAGDLERDAWRRLVLVQVFPAVLLGGLYLWHLAPTLESDLMGDALAAGGWLTDWLVKTPADAWTSFVAFQNLHFPTDFQGRSAALLLAAIGASALRRDWLVVVLVGAALSVALVASFLGVYPFGPSRHNTWLLIFTLPTLGCLAGYLMESSRRAGLAVVGVLAVVAFFGARVEGALGAYPLRSNAAEERVLRRVDLAPLVVERLSPEAGPSTILMSDQSYNVLMPLYAVERERLTLSADSSRFSFSYGARTVIVLRRWDWGGWEDVSHVAEDIVSTPGVDSRTVLLVAGGWGSSLFPGVPAMDESNVILEGTWVFGPVPRGPPLLRMMAVVVDLDALADQLSAGL